MYSPCTCPDEQRQDYETVGLFHHVNITELLRKLGKHEQAEGRQGCIELTLAHEIQRVARQKALYHVDEWR
jgi:hypothetical protein